jgi:hypothetical protein
MRFRVSVTLQVVFMASRCELGWLIIHDHENERQVMYTCTPSLPPPPHQRPLSTLEPMGAHHANRAWCSSPMPMPLLIPNETGESRTKERTQGKVALCPPFASARALAFGFAI